MTVDTVAHAEERVRYVEKLLADAQELVAVKAQHLRYAYEELGKARAEAADGLAAAGDELA